MRPNLWAVLAAAALSGACGTSDTLLLGGEDDEDATSAESELGQCREANCKCFEQLRQATDGRPVDMGIVNRFIGPGNPADMFANGGSENIPVTCRTVKYLVEHDPRWLEGYFDAQGNRFLGGEQFSSTYTALSAGNVITALGHARARNHQALIGRASSWLRSYWAVLALASVQDRPAGQQFITATGTRSDPATNGGYGVAIVGTRSYVNADRGSGLQRILLSLALLHPNRGFRGSLDASYGYYGGLRAAVRTAGYPLDGTGHANLQSRSPGPEVFGLTATERQTLAGFIASGGTSGLSSVLAMLPDTRLSAPLTLVRTSGGVINWFGLSDNSDSQFNGRKGSTYTAAAVELNANRSRWLSRTSRQNSPEPGRIWREGDSICGESTLVAKDCLPFPAGQLVYEVQFRRGVAPRCIGGSACGVQPPPPGPGIDNAAFVGQSVPTALAPGQSFTALLTLRNSGTSTWSAGTLHRLGSQSPANNETFGAGRLELPGAVSPGQSATFSAALRAPAAPGRYIFQWRMLREGVAWFGSPTPTVTIDVGGAPPQGQANAAFVSQTVPLTVSRGGSFSVQLTLRNSGGTTWTRAAKVGLGSQSPQDNLTWGAGRIPLATSANVAPGASYTFTATVRAPATAGTYAFGWRMLQEGVAWFGEATPVLAIRVQ